MQLSVIRFIICTCILLLLTCVVPWGFWNALCSPNRKVSFPVMLWQGVPFFVFIFVLLQWPFFSGSGILIPGRANFFCFIMSACLVFIRWMPTVVLCNFLHQPFPTYIWTIFPFLVGYLVLKYLPSIAAYYNPTSELVIFSVFAIFLLLNYLQWLITLSANFASIYESDAFPFHHSVEKRLTGSSKLVSILQYK